ncbi:MAG: hypothetical protein L6Q99_14565 [Planctomycetes bacterium]|nr:hypothetical protein [Planctomycetota bacterium]
MSDTQALVLVLALIYLADCVAWVRRGAVAFRALAGRRFAAALPSPFTGSAKAGLTWTNPLPPLGTLFVAESLPVALSSDGLASVPGLELDPRAPRVHEWRAKRWSDVHEVRAIEKELWLDGHVFAVADTPRTARELATLVETLRTAPRERRTKLLERALAARCDVASARERVERFFAVTAKLRFATNTLFVFLAGLVPAALWRFGIILTWPFLLGGLVLGVASVAWLFARAHRELFPNERSARRRGVFLIALSPPEAVRAVDALGRAACASFDPLALATVLDEAPRRELARRILIDTRHPLPPPVSVEPFAVECEREFRGLVRAARERALGELGLDAKTLLAPPAPEEAGARSYCLRCELDRTEPAGACNDCGAELAPRG